MKAALYARVSTSDQVEGFSIDAQINSLKEYCAKNNINVYKDYIDEGISGQKENRPEFQKMIKDAENKLFNIILVHKYDRFARKVELSQKIKNRLSKCSVNVISITEPIEDSPMGFFVSGLHELMAEYYVRNLAQEVKKGMRERVKSGLHNGSVPYGYKTDKETGIMIPNEPQSSVVKKIFQMYIEGYGTARISNWLQDNGISPAIPGAVWNHFSVLYILKNVKYIGYIRHAGEIYKGVHDAIIDEQTFNMAQKYLVDRTVKREPRGKNELKFMLLGLARCGVCGKKMGIHVAWKNSRKNKDGDYYYYYSCSGSRKHENALKCTHSKYYPTEALENSVLERLNHILETRTVIQQNNSNNDYLLTAQIEKIENEKIRAKAAYLSGVFTLEEYSDIQDECKIKILNIKKELSNFETSKNVYKEISNGLEKISNETSASNKRIILSKFINSIKVYPDKIEIDF